MVDPEVSPERTCMLERFLVVLQANPPLKDIYHFRQLLAHIPPLNSVKRYVGTISS